MNLTRLESKTRVFILGNLYPLSLVEDQKIWGTEKFGFEENFGSERNLGAQKTFRFKTIVGL